MNTKCSDISKMKILVEVSTMVTQSSDFFEIKDKIIEKMLEVVHPTKACVNLFYKNNYQYAYLVCSETLDYVPQVFPTTTPRGVKIDFQDYPEYIRESVKEKKIIYIKNVFEDDRAIGERSLAKNEGYIGRIVFPFIINHKVVGFMTCFLREEDILTEQDIDFISSIASLLALSVEITDKNNRTLLLVQKLRGAISSINEATKKLYLNRNINEFLQHLSKQATDITNSKDAIILIDENEYKDKLFNYYSTEGSNKGNLEKILSYTLKQNHIGHYENNINIKDKDGNKINSYIYYKLKNKNKIMGCIICSNSQSYTNDDLNILSILAKQVAVGMQLYKYNVEEVKHKVLANELNLLNQQQKLIMDKSKMECNDKKELDFYHRPARVVGGDFYYAVKLDENKIVYIVADVMGHGIVSNYVVAMIKGAFKVLAYQYSTPADIMTNLNKLLYDEFDKMGVFTTCLINLVNMKENTIAISNAGHYSPIMIKSDGSLVNNIKCKKGVPIGVLEDTTYVNNTLDISDYPMVCMYTDGILEIKNDNKEEYGIEGLENFMKNNFKFNQETIIDNLKDELNEFSRKDSYDDDILIVMLRDK